MPRTPLVPLVLTLLLATGLAGCFGTDDGPEGPPERPVPEEVQLHKRVWSGAAPHEDAVPIEKRYDHLISNYTHSGQALGLVTYTGPDGSEMDGSAAGTVHGRVQVDRVLPSALGTARITLPATLQGAGVHELTGITNQTPTTLIAVTLGERADGTGPFETTMRFHVPAQIDRLEIRLVAEGPVAPTVTVTDPAGNERATLRPDGATTTKTSTDATDGLWTLHLEGPYENTVRLTVSST